MPPHIVLYGQHCKGGEPIRLTPDSESALAMNYASAYQFQHNIFWR